jgi:dihydrofolate synthase/folylpolyglutamate synthase
MNTNLTKKDEILNKIFSLHKNGILPGLERTLKLLEKLDNPHLKLKSVHVAGTNGKGSVCSVCASVLKEAGFKVGLYTSPHIFEFNERIKIGGKNISDEDLVLLATPIIKLAEEIGATFFEITTALAFDYFVKNNVDIAVIETGLGGRYDSTNVITPLVSVITQIDLDHTEYLGESLEEIATEKAGIIKKDVPVIVLENKPNLKKIFIDKATFENAEIRFVADYCKIISLQQNQDFTMTLNLSINNKIYEKLKHRLSGKHQILNLLVAIEALEEIKSQFNWTDLNLKNGLVNIQYNTGLRGRIEVLTTNPLWIADVGHNPAAIKLLVDTMQTVFGKNRKYNFVFAAMADKDINQMLALIKPICNELILTRPKIERADQIDNMNAIAFDNRYGKISLFYEVKQAVNYAKEQNQDTIIVGSFYLLNEALADMKLSPFKL